MSDPANDSDAKRAKRRSGGARLSGPDVATSYTVDVAGQSVVLSLSGDRVTIDGVELPATITRVPDSPIWILRVGDAVYELVPQRTDRRGGYVISMAGERVAVEALDERARAVRSLRASAATPTGPEPVRAPMPGLVTRVLVSPGDAVKAGASLVVMEAMKMENELRAKADARVRSVLVQPGTAVEKGTVLVELE
jgi:pyruvate carboxylase subunit B